MLKPLGPGHTSAGLAAPRTWAKIVSRMCAFSLCPAGTSVWGSCLSSTCVNETFKPLDVPFLHSGHLQKPRRWLYTIPLQESLRVPSARLVTEPGPWVSAATGEAAIAKARGRASH